MPWTLRENIRLHEQDETESALPEGNPPVARDDDQRAEDSEDRAGGADVGVSGWNSSEPNDPASSEVEVHRRRSSGSRSRARATTPTKYSESMLMTMWRIPSCRNPPVTRRQYSCVPLNGAGMGCGPSAADRTARRGSRSSRRRRRRAARRRAVSMRNTITLIAISACVARGTIGTDLHAALDLGALPRAFRAAHPDRRRGHAVRADRPSARRARDPGLARGVSIADGHLVLTLSAAVC